METKRNLCFVKIIACILAISLLAPIGANAAVQDTVAPLASDYLMAYTAYICAMGQGELEIWFRVTGTATWADIGVLSIILYESTDNSNWYWVETYRHNTDEGMLAHNTFAHMDCVSYQGVAGRYYKAYVCIWAGSEDDGDARYMWTPVELAT